ncbi:MAG: hypothetical protein GF307_10805 [candidate division Zixibacteria bacterium]|nr:hypothetical protein [candidate division Zixibacteria bacterium]
MKVLLGILICAFAFAPIANSILLEEYYNFDEDEYDSYLFDGLLSSFAIERADDLIYHDRGLKEDRGFTSFYFQQAFGYGIYQDAHKSTKHAGYVAPGGFKRIGFSYKSRITSYIGNGDKKASTITMLRTSPVEGWRASVEYKTISSGKAALFKRSLLYSGKGLLREVVVGNYTTRIGTGLNIGRSDYQDGNTADLYDSADFLNTPTGNYNGAFVSMFLGGYRPYGFYSYKDYKDFDKTVFSGGIEKENKRYVIGLTLLSQVVETKQTNRIFGDVYGGFYVNARLKPVNFLAEISLSADCGPAFNGKAEFIKRNFESAISAWSYPREYFNLSSGGISDKDDKTFYFGAEAISLTSSRRDRRGILVDNQYKLGEKTGLTGAFAYYSQGYESFDMYELSGGFRYRTGNSVWSRWVIGYARGSYYTHDSRAYFSQGFLTVKPSHKTKLRGEFYLSGRHLADIDYNPKASYRYILSANYRLSENILVGAGGALKRRVWVYSYTDYSELFTEVEFVLDKRMELNIRFTGRDGYGDSTLYFNLSGEF